MPLIAVSIPPQEWFASRIAGGRVRIMVLAGPGQNPHSFEPSPRQIRALAEAKAWILSGTEFEISLRPKIEKLFPGLFMVDGTAGVAFRTPDGHEEDGSGEKGEQSRRAAAEPDRHTWLGEAPAKILAAHIRDALCRIDPERAAEYAGNCAALQQEIDAQFAALRVELEPLKGKTVFVYHPGFGYFLDEFGIKQEAVETGGKEPGPRDLERLIALAKREQAAAIFVQAQFPVNAAKTAADAAGAKIVTLDPLSADWLANIRFMADALKAASGRFAPNPVR